MLKCRKLEKGKRNKGEKRYYMLFDKLIFTETLVKCHLFEIIK